MGLTYRDAGVDVEGGNAFVKRIGPLVKETFTERVITDIGGFGALFSGKFPEMEEPVLVSGTDGVGTKLRIAQLMNRHDTIGIDAVAMCVNDIITSGAQPLFFLDYISCGKLREDVMVDIVKGIAQGCKEGQCSLIGGETAEHPNVMEDEDYDIAGFAVGVVDKKNIINGRSIAPGDRIIGLPSSGIHSNGYSLVRKVFFDLKGYTVASEVPGLEGTLGDNLITPTRLYTEPVMACIRENILLKGLVHITGGGFYENIPRILPDNTGVEIDTSSFTVPSIFSVIQKEGDITTREMYTTFNMGIGMMVFVEADAADAALKVFKATGHDAVEIGKVVSCDKEERVILS
jgi:phosphoribosylformylglycinamidine cyclo-ligase